MESFFAALERKRLVPINIFPSVFRDWNLFVFDFSVLTLAVSGNQEIAFNVRFFIYLTRS